MLRDFLTLAPNKPLLANPGFEIADAQTEPWKTSAITGIAKGVSGKSAELFGPRSLAWLREHLVDYETVRDAVREQHPGNRGRSARQRELAGRRGAAVRKSAGKS